MVARDCVDELAALLLNDHNQDAHGHPLQHTFWPRSFLQTFLPRARRLLVVAGCIGLVLWLLLEVGLAASSNAPQGFVAGIFDSYEVQPRVIGNATEYLSGSTSVCSCTYNRTGSMSPMPPFGELVDNKDYDQTLKCPNTLWDYCTINGTTLGTRLPLLNSSDNISKASDSTVYTYRILKEYCLGMILSKLENPTSGTQLKKDAWQGARYALITSKLHDGYARAVAAVRAGRLPPQNLNDMEVDTGELMVKVVRAVLSKYYRHLGLLAMDFDEIIELSCPNCSTYQVSCKFPQVNESPWRLQERCVNFTDGSLGYCTPGQPDAAYEGYKEWCAPEVCHDVTPRPKYQNAVTVMSAIGGIWGAISMALFGWFWRLCLWLDANVLPRPGQAVTEGPVATRAVASMSAVGGVWGMLRASMSGRLQRLRLWVDVNVLHKHRQAEVAHRATESGLVGENKGTQLRTHV